VLFRSVSGLQHYLDNFNPQWFSLLGHRRFDSNHSRTELGHIGEMQASGTIVIRLEPKGGVVPERLREASYRTFKGRTWQADLTEKDWADIQSTEANGDSYALLPGKTNLAVANIACYLDGGNALLPLPVGSGRLENLMAVRLQRNILGAVLEEGPGLVVFDACYGPGATIDSPPGATNEDLAIPAGETNALDQVLAELHLEGLSQAETLRRLNGFFQDKFTYSTWQGPAKPRRTNETALSRFLLRNRSGHCEYFATAGVLLLRRLGIPARYAVGFAVHESVGRKYVVRQRDAHAWCLVWNQRAGFWEDFDPTPASWVEAEAKRASALQFLSDAWSRLGFEFSKFWWGQTNLRRYLLWGVAPVLGLLLYQVVFRRRRRQRRDRGLSEAAILWPGLDSEFYQLERRLAGRGLIRHPSEPLSDWLQRAAQDPALAELRQPLEELLRLHYRYRFDPQGLSPEERRELSREAKACLEKVSHAALLVRFP
jgi:protein-glutamine gamma-glutamyltransferase